LTGEFFVIKGIIFEESEINLKKPYLKKDLHVLLRDISWLMGEYQWKRELL